jgi:hypothetical protein
LGWKSSLGDGKPEQAGTALFRENGIAFFVMILLSGIGSWKGAERGFGGAGTSWNCDLSGSGRQPRSSTQTFCEKMPLRHSHKRYIMYCNHIKKRLRSSGSSANLS